MNPEIVPITYDFDTLYERYSKQYPKLWEYREGKRKISEADLLNVLTYELTLQLEDPDPDILSDDEPNTMMAMYSINEAQWLLQQLEQRSSPS